MSKLPVAYIQYRKQSDHHTIIFDHGTAITGMICVGLGDTNLCFLIHCG